MQRGESGEAKVEGGGRRVENRSFFRGGFVCESESATMYVVDGRP